MNSKAAYQTYVDETIAALNRIKKRVNTLSLLRLGVIILGCVGIFQAVQTQWVWLVLLSAIGVILVFMWLVAAQARAEREKQWLSDFLAVNQNELDIEEGKPNLYPNGDGYRSGRHPYSDDLDIYGDYSLFGLFNRCATKAGNERFASWLSQPADLKDIVERQAAVRELAAKKGWSQHYQAKLLFELNSKTDVKQVFKHLMDEQLLRFGNQFLKLYVRFAPWLFAVSILLAVINPLFWRLVSVFAVVHLMTTFWFAGKVGVVSARVGRAGQLLNAYASAFKYIEDTTWGTAKTQELYNKLTFSAKEPVSLAFKRLGTLLDKLDFRLNMLVGAVLNMIFLWDLKQVFAIQNWQKTYKEGVLEAFEVASEFEALNTLAVLHKNREQWAFPDIHPAEECVMICENIAHPLILPEVSVANDYSIEGHHIALITGSNMAGKSTFLRTVGANTVLALAGAPVCAQKMEVSVFRLVTYMRIKDALNESTSTFKAELDRMQMILHTVKEQPDTYFLIDEMLRGTNSVDKYLGSKAIIKQLIADRGVGMVATHDLKLADLEKEYPQDVRNYHFDIQVKDGEMLFDYKLKNGECTIFNATMLLERIGIKVGEA